PGSGIDKKRRVNEVFPSRLDIDDCDCRKPVAARPGIHQTMPGQHGKSCVELIWSEHLIENRNCNSRVMAQTAYEAIAWVERKSMSGARTKRQMALIVIADSIAKLSIAFS